MGAQNNVLTARPTPIEKLSLDLNGVEFYVKRDDLIPFSFGGNKARKAFKFFGEILTGGYDVIATYGSGSSNHCRVVANLAAKYKIPCYVVSPEEGYGETYNSRLVGAFGAKIVKAPLDRIKETIDELIASLAETCKPYFIPGGGHGILGVEAYVEAYREIAEFERLEGVNFDYIFHASGTGATQAGLICGAALAGRAERNIVGVSVARANPRGGAVVEESVEEYLDFLSFRGDRPKVVFDDSYICGGYGKYNAAIVDVVRETMFNDGIPLNTTYTGKAFWGMKEYVAKHKIREQKILFLHTGGAPLFFDDLRDAI